LIENLPEAFFEVHCGLPREGPGDNESTKKAYLMLRELPEKPRILDVGCGPGMQTIQLAKLTNGEVTALDFYSAYLEQLSAKAKQEGVADKIKPVKGDMFKLEFPDSSFDVIWSEGAIYIIGFEKALNGWKPLLAPKGYIVASHIAWLKPNPPKELRQFWQTNYPNIKTVQENLQIAQSAGYQVVSYFTLPRESWFENYYNLIEAKLPNLRQKYKNDKKALDYLDSEQHEINLFRRYNDYYGYVFFILQTQA
jgi:ubiquinone/menaquinone biosynthesis C-methylase UbiE